MSHPETPSGFAGVLVREQRFTRVVGGQRTEVRAFSATAINTDDSDDGDEHRVLESRPLISRNSERPSGSCLSVFLYIVILFHITIIVVGSVYFYDCPGQKNVPLYLVVAGAWGIFLYTAVWVYCEQETGQKSRPLVFIIAFLGFCAVGWFCVGCYWTFPAFSSVREQQDNEFCNGIVYWMTFSCLAVPLAVPALICVCTCCLGAANG